MKRVALSLLLLAGVLAGAISAQTPPASAPQTPGRQAGPPPAPPSGPWPAPPARTVERDHTALFNGKDLTGWKISGPETGFGVEQGAIVAHGLNGAGHLFYDGTVANHVFRNFNLRLDVMARVRSNGGVPRRDLRRVTRAHHGDDPGGASAPNFRLPPPGRRRR